MKAPLKFLPLAGLLLLAGCATGPDDSSASALALPDGVRELPEGASWQDVFDASEGNTEWEAKTYEMGPQDLSFEVMLKDPIDAEMPELPYPVVLQKDANGYPREYRMFLRTGVCLDGTCKLLEATLFWDPLGRFLRFEYPQGTPFTKTEHDPFKPDDYERLHRILKDTRSILGTHPLSYFVIEPEEGEEVDWDSETSATPPEAKAAVIEGAAYTTWVLWRWVHGEVVKQLLAQTNANLSDGYLLKCLDSNDGPLVEFALKVLQSQGLSDDRMYQVCLAVLDAAEPRECILALDVLTTHCGDLAQLQLDLVERLGVNHDSSGVILDYIKEIDDADPKLWQQLAAQIQKLSDFRWVDASLALLNTMAADDPIVRDQIMQLLEHDNLFMVRRAERFLK